MVVLLNACDFVAVKVVLCRARFISTVMVACLSLLGCSEVRYGTPPGEQHDAAVKEKQVSGLANKFSPGFEKPAVRDRPIALKVEPVAGLDIPLAEIKELLLAGRPIFLLKKLPVGATFHAVRLWGHRESPFDLSSPYPGERVYDCRLLYNTLISSVDFRAVSGFRLEILLERSEFGISVRSADELGWGNRRGENHVGKYVQVMAELGVPSGEAIKLSENDVGTLREIVVDEAMRLHYDEELDFVATGLCRYLASDKWRNRFNQVVSLDGLASRIAERRVGSGSCWGVHALNALATIRAVDEQVPILKKTTKASVEGHIHEAMQLLKRSQSSDGSWGPEWAGRTALFSWGNDHADRLAATAHHLEWLLSLPVSLRIPDIHLRKAVGYILASRHEIPLLVHEDWHIYMPASHAVRAVILSMGFNSAGDAWRELLAEESQ